MTPLARCIDEQRRAKAYLDGPGDDKDGKHVCPLHLDIIERAIRLWSNPGDLILSPFGGIGSEGVGAMRAGRRFVGIELKPEYFDVACRFLADEERAITSQIGLFDQEATA